MQKAAGSALCKGDRIPGASCRWLSSIAAIRTTNVQRSRLSMTGAGAEVVSFGAFFYLLVGKPFIRAKPSLALGGLSVQTQTNRGGLIRRSGLPRWWQAWGLCCTSPANRPRKSGLAKKKKEKPTKSNKKSFFCAVEGVKTLISNANACVLPPANGMMPLG